MVRKPEGQFSKENVVREIRERQENATASKDHFLNKDEIELLLTGNEKLFRSWGFSDVKIVGEPIVNYDGVVFGVQLDCYNDKQDTDEQHAVTLSIENGRCSYKFSKNNEELFSFVAPREFEEQWLMDESRNTKVVKSRPKFMYPELFKLDYDDVWPKDAAIAVIGDPYQTCDGERITLVEYEYADEIMPPWLYYTLQERRAPTAEELQGWHEQMFHEDITALERVYGMFTPDRHGNPYYLAAQRVIDAASTLGASLSIDSAASPKVLHACEKKIAELKSLVHKLIDGSWHIDDITPLKSDGVEMESYAPVVRTFFEYKQAVMEKLGDQKAWKGYVDVWDAYLKRISVETLKASMPDIEEKVRQVWYWLKELPSAKSPQRVARGVDWLQNTYHDIVAAAPRDERGDVDLDYYDGTLVDTYAKGVGASGALGYFIPGYPTSLRTRKALESLLRRADNTLYYAQHIWPKLQALHDDMNERGVNMDATTERNYLHSFERPLVQQSCFTRLAHKAVPLHGFFPYKVDIEPQDRILALTSVTMHGWNSCGEDDFQRDIETALPFLKQNGKYILGPINQRVYFGGIDEGFDADALTRALTRLRDDGKITFEFKKGRREYDDREFDEEDVVFSPETDVLLSGESAHSLVITRK